MSIVPLIGYYLAFATYLCGVVASAVIAWFHGDKGKQKTGLIEIALLAVIAVSWILICVKIVLAAETSRGASPAQVIRGIPLRFPPSESNVGESDPPGVGQPPSGASKWLLSQVMLPSRGAVEILPPARGTPLMGATDPCPRALPFLSGSSRN